MPSSPASRSRFRCSAAGRRAPRRSRLRFAACVAAAAAAACARADLLVGSGSESGLALSRWSLTANASSPLGTPLAGLSPSPSTPAWLRLPRAGGAAAADGVLVFAPQASPTTEHLVQWSLASASRAAPDVALSSADRCFLLFAAAADVASGASVSCLSEVDAGRRTTTALRRINRSTGKVDTLASVLPYYGPAGPAAHDAARGALLVLYFCAPPCAAPQGTYLLSLDDATAATRSRAAVAADVRVIALAQGAGATFALASLGAGAGGTFAGTIDAASAAFTPLAASPDFAKRFAYIGTNTAVALGGGALWFAAVTQSPRAPPGAAAAGPPVSTPWLVGVDNSTGALTYAAPSDGVATFDYLLWL